MRQEPLVASADEPLLLDSYKYDVAEVHACIVNARDWLASLAPGHTKAAAFDTRYTGLAGLTGRASKAISRKLRKHGFEVVARPESFLVDSKHHLEPGEEARAQEWGKRLAPSVVSMGVTDADRPERPPTRKET